MSRKVLQMQRQIALSRVKVNYQMDCMWRIVIEGQPDNLDLFSREVSYGKGTIESDTINLRTGDLNSPTKKEAGSVSVVFNDDDNGSISEFINSLQDKIFNDDGTQNLPVDYLFKLTIYRLKDDGTERLDAQWSVYVEENNDYSGNNDSRTELGTFSATFKKYKSIGN
ncbi:hypothetical protein HWV00_21230 (plasmid) [Moritella sp. 24]|uniref:hypothetical protein n=1 Tax=Moritella sp. 24 TaxID=2746230 RepID=UPI001BA82C43|nr:hypothetical protein [Moritella sp. 24]QUM78798.1 hypothetical protein HWV00_21230 [Moritella sp. 24]